MVNAPKSLNLFMLFKESIVPSTHFVIDHAFLVANITICLFFGPNIINQRITTHMTFPFGKNMYNTHCFVVSVRKLSNRDFVLCFCIYTSKLASIWSYAVQYWYIFTIYERQHNNQTRKEKKRPVVGEPEHTHCFIWKMYWLKCEWLQI